MAKKEIVFHLPHSSRLVLRKGGTSVFLDIQEIDWIEAKRQYTLFHSGEQHHSVRENITDVETQLDPHCFIRIHRSTIVNLYRVREIRSWFGGECKVVLINGTELRCSRRYKTKLDELMLSEKTAVQ